MFVQFLDTDEFQAWDQKDDPVLHVELRALASVLLIAPLGANTMAKICNGVCDNIVTQVTRAWHFESGSEVKYPFIVAPAMNTMMYEHPITEIQIKYLEDTLKAKVLPTVLKKLMCGDEGYGAMIDVLSIVKEVEKAAASLP